MIQQLKHHVVRQKTDVVNQSIKIFNLPIGGM